MKKVMFLCANFTYGGIEQYILNVIDNIDREVYNISILLLENRKYDNEAALIERDVQIFKLSGNKKEEYKKLLENEKIDIVHSTLGYNSYLYANIALKYGVEKVIIHSHTAKSGASFISAKAKIAKRLTYWYANKFICKRTINLACSELAADYLFDKKQKVEIVYNGIDIDKFLNEKIDDRIFNKYGIDKNKTNILHIGRMDMQKNSLFLIKIFSELVKLNDNYNLIYVGDGILKNDINNLVNELNIEKYIKYISFTDEISKIMKCSDCFLLPSLYEGLPVTLVEAQASGLKCFISSEISKYSDFGLCRFIGLDKDEKTWANIIHSEIDKDILKCDYEKLNTFKIKSTVKCLEQIYG